MGQVKSLIIVIIVIITINIIIIIIIIIRGSREKQGKARKMHAKYPQISVKPSNKEFSLK